MQLLKSPWSLTFLWHADHEHTRKFLSVNSAMSTALDLSFSCLWTNYCVLGLLKPTNMIVGYEGSFQMQLNFASDVFS